MQAGVLSYLQHADWLTRALAWVLVAMSIMSWCVLLFKSWTLLRARMQLPRAMAAFWSASDPATGIAALERTDRERWVLPLAIAARRASAIEAVPSNLAQAGDRDARLVRAIRTVLSSLQRRVDWGQTGLASIAASAPFVGLLGTVWGIQRALASLAAGGNAGLSLDDLTRPVGEALVMTAAGLAVAIPALLAYNLLGRLGRTIADDLDGFAYDCQAFWASEGAGVTAAQAMPTSRAAPAEPGAPGKH